MGRPTHRSSPLFPSLSAADLTYLAMRAGPIAGDALRQRAGTLSVATRLVRIGHATATTDGVNYIYRLTPAGRAACPSRREKESEIRHAYAGVEA